MTFKILPLLSIILALGFNLDAEALENGLALKPPMGWLAWERFTCEIDCKTFPDDCINSQLFKEMADRLANDGYKDAGYTYINIDDCWSTKHRDNKTDRLVADPDRFPEGIADLAYYVHHQGLKLGIYGDCGTSTCAGYPAQLKSESETDDNYFYKDADTFDQWNVDSFKFDGCNIPNDKAEAICPKMSLALAHNVRPVLLVCEWPFYMIRESKQPDFALAQKSCNAWRYYEDVEDSWSSVLSIIDFTVKMQDTILKYHGPKNWFDPDQLVIGNFGLSLDQAKAQMAIWCLWSAPLYMSNDLRKIDPEFAEILKNKYLIEVNQDKFGVFGLLVAENRSVQAFVKPVEKVQNDCPSFVVVYLNRNTLGNSNRVSFKVRDLLHNSIPAIQEAGIGKRTNGTYTFGEKCPKRIDSATSNIHYNVQDLMNGKKLSQVSLNGDLTLDVNPSGVRAVKLIEDTGHQLV